MKKGLPYFLIALLLIAVIFLLITSNSKANRRLDERLTLRQQDKIPYGTWVAYKNLKHLFPNADIYTNRREPGYWDSLYIYENRQALIIVTRQFQADETEMDKLIAFAEHGNDVFISAMTISHVAGRILECSTNDYSMPSYFNEELINPEDTLNVSLNTPPFGKELKYSYPGKKYSSVFTKTNDETTNVLGTQEGLSNFIHLRTGKGNFYVHLSPLAFSNYFLLHGDNMGYFENAFSVISPDTKRVVWDEYYLNKRNPYSNNRKQKDSMLNVLFRYPALKAALLTALFTLLLFVLLEMRRKQRYIPVITKPRNDSLDFVRTIGRLYYDKGDHRNLCRKMSAYFLEHIRSRYKLSTVKLDDQFIRDLQFKSGYEEAGLRGIVSFIQYLDDAPAISQEQLNIFHRQLESFYKST